MINAMKQFFSLFTALFLSGEKLANAAVALSAVAEAAASEMLEVSQIERAKRMAKLRGELRVVEAEAATMAPATTKVVEVKAA